jgi:hypothetical protein
MIRTRHITSALALSCAVAASSAWADAENTAVSGVRDGNITSKQLATDVLQQVAPGPYGLRVQARNGYVRLSGTVATVNDWKKADETVRNAASGADIQNNLSIMIR